MTEVEHNKISRRKFLGVSTAAAVGGIVGGVIVGAVGGYLAGQTAAPEKTVTETRTVTTTLAPGAPTTVTQTMTQTVTQTVSAARFEAAPRVIKIGGTVGVTGPFASSVAVQGKMYDAWAKLLNEKFGGIYVEEYGRHLPVQVIWYDDKGDPPTVEKYYTKLCTEDKIDIAMGPFTAVNAFPAATICERYGVPEIDLQAAEVPIFNKKWVFGSLDIMPKWLINYMEMLKDEGKAKSIAFINSDEPFGNEVNAGGIELANRMGFNVLGQLKYTFETTDFTPIITKLKEWNPDVVSMCDPTGILQATFWKQARALGFKPKDFHACFGALGPVARAMGGLENWITADLYWHEELPYQGVWGKWFYEQVQKEAGYTDFDWPWVTIAFFGLEMAAKAIEIAGSLDKEKIRKALDEMYILTIAGPHRAWHDPGPWFLDDPQFRAVGAGLIRAFPVQWQNGKRVILWPPEIRTGRHVYPAPFE
jgi:branched-chain amino acid transport system substrate-binding protein